MWVLKCKIFAQESTCSKDFFKQSYDELWFVKKCQNRTSKVNFLCQKSLFSKIMPNFWRTCAPRILKIQWFPLSILIFGQNFCFSGPTIFKIPQPNRYYYVSSMYTNISFTSGVTQECLKENQFISCALLERKYVLEAVQYVKCTTLLANQKRVLSMTLDLKRPPLFNRLHGFIK